ncbi:MAG TPA: hypothetical protein VGF94_19720, partial [Kofleriaceae bacterium]|jgi:hypothetical protein
MSKTESTATPSFDPMAMFAASQQAFQQMMTDAQGRARAFADEYAQLEAQLVARAKQAIDTWAQLAHDALAYSAQLSAEARKLGVDAARKMGAQ